MVNSLLSIDTEFSWIYELINDLKYSLFIGNFNHFKYHLQRSKERPLRRYIRTTLQTLEYYSEAIQNSCHYNLSNGHLEGINNKIKTMKRTGFGYRNFDHLKTRAMISLIINKE
ncbi:transposase [Amphibacillus xylanus]